MTDPKMATYLRRMIDEARKELARRESAYEHYIGSNGVDLPAVKRENRPTPRDVWKRALANGVHLTTQELFDALKAAGWSAKFEVRAFRRAMTTNRDVGNIAIDLDGKYYVPLPECKEAKLNEHRKKLNPKLADPRK